MDHAPNPGGLLVAFHSRLSFGPVRGISRVMPEVTILYNIDADLMPLLNVMRGKRKLADFLRGATDLGVAELLSDAARRIADRQVADLQEVQHMDEEPIVWRQLESFLSTAPAPPPPARAGDREEEAERFSQD
jgi:hypothetical protein